MVKSLLRGVTATVILATVACAAGAASIVTTGGFFYQYTGPVGAFIYGGYGNPPYPTHRDPALIDSYFSVEGGSAVKVDPQIPYQGYEDAAFAGTGTATFSGFIGGRIEFWNRLDNSVDFAHNILEISGAVTPGVMLGDTFKLATISFTNGSWFRVLPPYDPGLGLLYAESQFAFSLIAQPDPIIGTGYFPGPRPYHVWNDTLVLASTFGSATPDLLSFLNSPLLGAFGVDEGVTGTVEIWGRIGSLDPVELRNPSAGVTLISINAVPEPGSLALLGLGLFGLGALRRRKTA